MLHKWQVIVMYITYICFYTVSRHTVFFPDQTILISLAQARKLLFLYRNLSFYCTSTMLKVIPDDILLSSSKQQLLHVNGGFAVRTHCLMCFTHRQMVTYQALLYTGSVFAYLHLSCSSSSNKNYIFQS